MQNQMMFVFSFSFFENSIIFQLDTIFLTANFLIA